MKTKNPEYHIIQDLVESAIKYKENLIKHYENLGGIGHAVRISCLRQEIQDFYQYAAQNNVVIR